MTTLALVLALSAPLLTQEPVAAQTAAQALDALVERTNGLQAFRARWVMRKGEDPPVALTLSYRAPDRMRLDMGAAVGEDPEAASTWVLGTVLAVRMSRSDGDSMAGEVDYASLPGPVAAAHYALEQRFPMPVRGLGPGAAIDVHWGVDAETDKAEFDFQLSYSPGDRRTLVRWLDHLRGDAEACSLEDEQLLWKRPDDRIALRVSLRSGFLEALDMVGAEGERMELRLEALDLAPDLAEDVFQLPPRGEGARELFPDGGARMMGTPGVARRTILARVNGALTDGRREWDASTREDASAVLRVLHTGVLSSMHATMSERVSARVADLLTWMRDEQAKAPPGDRMVEQQLREAAREWREGLARSIDSELPRLLASLEPPPEDAAGHLPDLVALEAELMDEVFDEVVRQPLLGSFDQRVAEVLDR